MPIGKPFATNLRELNLMTKIYAYNYHLKESSPDLDVTAELTGGLLEALFWILDDTNISLLLIGGDFITTPGKSPPMGLDSLFTSGRKLLDITKVRTPRKHFTGH
jgi:hypothetical protein